MTRAAPLEITSHSHSAITVDRRRTGGVWIEWLRRASSSLDALTLRFPSARVRRPSAVVSFLDFVTRFCHDAPSSQSHMAFFNLTKLVSLPSARLDEKRLVGESTARGGRSAMKRGNRRRPKSAPGPDCGGPDDGKPSCCQSQSWSWPT